MSPIVYDFAIHLSPPPFLFEGTTNGFLTYIEENLRVINPSGYGSFAVNAQVSGVEEKGDWGPWLKDGVEWMVWDYSVAKYVPQHLNSSLNGGVYSRFTAEDGTKSWVSSTPLSVLPTPPAEIRQFPIVKINSQAELDELAKTGSGFCFVLASAHSGMSSGVYRWKGGSPPWTQDKNDAASGTPPSNWPLLTPYLDTTNGAWLYRNKAGLWTTMDGSPGDLKYVVTANVYVAQTQNPGWESLSVEELYGQGNAGAQRTPWLTTEAARSAYLSSVGAPSGVTYEPNQFPRREWQLPAVAPAGGARCGCTLVAANPNAIGELPTKTDIGKLDGDTTNTLDYYRMGVHGHALISSGGMSPQMAGQNVLGRADLFIAFDGNRDGSQFHLEDDCGDGCGDEGNGYTIAYTATEPSLGISGVSAGSGGFNNALPHNNMQPTVFLILLKKVR